MTALVPGAPVRLVRGENWWILDGGFFAGGGTKYSGPYETKEDAFTARRALESAVKSASFYIDAEVEPPTPELPTADRYRETYWVDSDSASTVWRLCWSSHGDQWWTRDEWYTPDEVAAYAPFTRLASRGVWQTEIVEEIAAWLDSESRIGSLAFGTMWAARVRAEFGSVVGE